jgi:hypothetical protein
VEEEEQEERGGGRRKASEAFFYSLSTPLRVFEALSLYCTSSLRGFAMRPPFENFRQNSRRHRIILATPGASFGRGKSLLTINK